MWLEHHNHPRIRAGAVMKIIKFRGFIITIWWWAKADNRQKKPTNGYGLIVERM
jgi:hypothetical protein